MATDTPEAWQLGHAHHVALKYHGPTNTKGARVSATWQGWHREDSKPVRRWFAYDYANRDQVARDAAEAFCTWLNDGDNRFQITGATLADNGSDGWSLHVKTGHRAEGGAA
jgi:hypothetical protein